MSSIRAQPVGEIFRKILGVGADQVKIEFWIFTKALPLLNFKEVKDLVMGLEDCQTEQEMLDEIQKKREMMIDSARITGFTSEDTIHCSQELDKIIYKYQCIKQKERQRNHEINIIFKQMMMIFPKVLVEV